MTPYSDRPPFPLWPMRCAISDFGAYEIISGDRDAKKIGGGLGTADCAGIERVAAHAPTRRCGSHDPSAVSISRPPAGYAMITLTRSVSRTPSFSKAPSRARGLGAPCL